MPDFAQVYGFIGSVFDPNATNHLLKLKQMDPINVETVSDLKPLFSFAPFLFQTFFFLLFLDGWYSRFDLSDYASKGSLMFMA